MKEKTLTHDLKDYISLNEASEKTPYSANYLGLLVRKRKLPAKKIKGKWMTTVQDVERYMSVHARVNGNVSVPGSQIGRSSAFSRFFLIAFGSISAVFVFAFPAFVVWGVEADGAQKVGSGDARVYVVSKNDPETVSSFEAVSGNIVQNIELETGKTESKAQREDQR